MALVDALGNLIRFVLLPGQRHDSIGVEPLITGLDFAALIGDKAFDNNCLPASLNERGAAAVIPSKADRAGRIPHDAEMYKWRHLVENFFCSLKAFRRIALATKRPMPALPVFSISSRASSQAADCKQALEHFGSDRMRTEAPNFSLTRFLHANRCPLGSKALARKRSRPDAGCAEPIVAAAASGRRSPLREASPSRRAGWPGAAAA
jgi:transposase